MDAYSKPCIGVGSSPAKEVNTFSRSGASCSLFISGSLILITSLKLVIYGLHLSFKKMYYAMTLLAYQRYLTTHRRRRSLELLIYK